MKTETGTLILLLIILVLIIGYFAVGHIQTILGRNTKKVDEAFVASRTSGSAPTLDNPEEFYDDYYVQRIDQSYFPESKNICRCAELYKHAYIGDFKKSSTKTLLYGANTGRFLDALAGVSATAIGVVSNKTLADKARQIAPKAKVIETENLYKMPPTEFPENTFTHFVVEDKNYYQIPTAQDRKGVIANAFKWLQPGGKLVIRAIDPTKFDPMIPSAVPIRGVNIQNYLEKRKHDSTVYFDDGSYISAHYTPIPSEQRAVFREDLYYPNGSLKRSHIHRWNIPPMDVVIEEVMSVGFQHTDSVPLKPCTSPGEQYLIFTKPEYKRTVEGPKV